MTKKKLKEKMISIKSKWIETKMPVKIFIRVLIILGFFGIIIYKDFNISIGDFFKCDSTKVNHEKTESQPED